jgi:hypothetical protein
VSTPLAVACTCILLSAAALGADCDRVDLQSGGNVGDLLRRIMRDEAAR